MPVSPSVVLGFRLRDRPGGEGAQAECREQAQAFDQGEPKGSYWSKRKVGGDNRCRISQPSAKGADCLQDNIIWITRISL